MLACDEVACPCREHQLHGCTVVGVRLPGGAGGESFGYLCCAPASEGVDDTGKEYVGSFGAVRLRWAEHTPGAVDLDDGAADDGGGRIGVEVKVLPCEAESFGYAPALEEQECHGGAVACACAR